MLHDAVLSRSLGAPDGLERRTLPRTSFPAELVLIWHHDPQTPIRYQVVDAHENGVRIRTTVPMIEGWDETHEDPALVTEAERRLHYGDPSHLRFYGRDVRGRIRAAGFDLAEYVAVEPDVSTHALHRGERIFVGRKPAAEGATDG